MAVALLLLSGLLSASAEGTIHVSNSTGCRKINESQVTFCKGFVGQYLIDKGHNETAFDNNAGSMIKTMQGCGFISKEFACEASFIRCENETGTVKWHGVCVENCLEGKTWSGRVCAQYNFDNFCKNSGYFDTDPGCILVAAPPGDESSDVWKWILGGVLIAGALSILASLGLSWWRTYQVGSAAETPAEFDFEKNPAPKKATDTYANLDDPNAVPDNSRGTKFVTAQQARVELARKAGSSGEDG